MEYICHELRGKIKDLFDECDRHKTGTLLKNEFKRLGKRLTTLISFEPVSLWPGHQPSPFSFLFLPRMPMFMLPPKE